MGTLAALLNLFQKAREANQAAIDVASNHATGAAVSQRDPVLNPRVEHQAQLETSSAADGIALSALDPSAMAVASLDQEAANLTQYERSYDAARKVCTIVDELTALAINRGEDGSAT